MSSRVLGRQSRHLRCAASVTTLRGEERISLSRVAAASSHSTGPVPDSRSLIVEVLITSAGPAS